jgi:hypothetical protein
MRDGVSYRNAFATAKTECEEFRNIPANDKTLLTYILLNSKPTVNFFLDTGRDVTNIPLGNSISYT